MSIFFYIEQDSLLLSLILLSIPVTSPELGSGLQAAYKLLQPFPGLLGPQKQSTGV